MFACTHFLFLSFRARFRFFFWLFRLSRSSLFPVLRVSRAPCFPFLVFLVPQLSRSPAFLFPRAQGLLCKGLAFKSLSSTLAFFRQVLFKRRALHQAKLSFSEKPRLNVLFLFSG